MRKISELAVEIEADPAWKKVTSTDAHKILKMMKTAGLVNATFGADLNGWPLLASFRSCTHQWKGPEARRLRAEIKSWEP